MRKSYCLEILTDGDVWFTKSCIYSKKDAKMYFDSEDINELAEKSIVRVVDNSGKVVFEKAN